MVDKISVQIALEGGAEIEKQLADISKAGQKAFSDITKSAEQAGGFNKLDPGVVEESFKRLGVTAPAEINKITAAVQSAGRLETLVAGIAAVENGFAAAGRAALVLGVTAIPAIAAAVVVATKATIGFAEAINKASTEAIGLGLSIEKFDQLRSGLQQAGIGAQAITTGIAKLKGELDKVEVKRISAELDALQKRGFALTGLGGARQELQKLAEIAVKTGAAGDLARQALEKLGLTDFSKLIQQATLVGAEGERARQQLQQMGLPISLDPVVAALGKLGITGSNVNAVLPQVIEKLRQMPDSVQRTEAATTLLDQKLGIELIQALRTGGVAVDQFKGRLGLLTTDQENAANGLVQAINRMEAAWSRLGSVTFAPQITAGINLVTAALEALNNLVSNFGWSTFSSAAVAAFNLITGAISAFTLEGMLSWLAQAVIGWTGLSTAVQGAIGWLLKFLGLQNQVKPLPGGAPLGGAGGGIGSNAAGGLLGGRGTGTSDSNLAWVSRGEHIMPARAVAQPGVLALLEALRRSGGNLSAVLNGMGRFALGGMVPRAMPAFAGGGMVGGHLGTLTLGLPSGDSVTVRASTGVVDQLRKEAALAQVRSGGRKPSRYA
jgi:hypothetical protein